MDRDIRERIERASERAAKAAERTAEAHEAAAEAHERHADIADEIGESVVAGHRAREQAQRLRAAAAHDRDVAEKERSIQRDV